MAKDSVVPQFSDAHKAEIFKLQRDAAGARLRKQAIIQQAEQQANAEIEKADDALNARLNEFTSALGINTPEHALDSVSLVVSKKVGG